MNHLRALGFALLTYFWTATVFVTYPFRKEKTLDPLLLTVSILPAIAVFLICL